MSLLLRFATQSWCHLGTWIRVKSGSCNAFLSGGTHLLNWPKMFSGIHLKVFYKYYHISRRSTSYNMQTVLQRRGLICTRHHLSRLPADMVCCSYWWTLPCSDVMQEASAEHLCQAFRQALACIWPAKNPCQGCVYSHHDVAVLHLKIRQTAWINTISPKTNQMSHMVATCNNISCSITLGSNNWPMCQLLFKLKLKGALFNTEMFTKSSRKSLSSCNFNCSPSVYVRLRVSVCRCAITVFLDSFCLFFNSSFVVSDTTYKKATCVIIQYLINVIILSAQSNIR